jgi:Na+/proline symporter
MNNAVTAMNNAPSIRHEISEARAQRNMRLSCLALGITLVFVLISRNLPEIYQWYLLGVATSFLLLFGVMISPLWKDEEAPQQQQAAG